MKTIKNNSVPCASASPAFVYVRCEVENWERKKYCIFCTLLFSLCVPTIMFIKGKTAHTHISIHLCTYRIDTDALLTSQCMYTRRNRQKTTTTTTYLPILNWNRFIRFYLCYFFPLFLRLFHSVDFSLPHPMMMSVVWVDECTWKINCFNHFVVIVRVPHSFSLICRLFRHLKFNCARSQLLFANAYYVYLQYEYTNGACTFSLQVFFCSSSLLLNVHGELHNLFAFYVHVCVCREHIFAKGNSFFMFVYGKPICNLDTGFGRHNNVLHKFLLIGNARAHSTHEWCTHDSICGLENTL